MSHHEKTEVVVDSNSPRVHPQDISQQSFDHSQHPDEEARGSPPKTSSTPNDRLDAPPEGGYGWVVVLGVFLINFHSWGINSTYGVFLAYYLSHNIFPGATYLDFAFVGGLSIGMAFVVAPLATNTTRWYGTRITLSIGIVFETIALITTGSCKQIWQLFLSQGVCFGVGMGFLFVASVGLAPQWFSKRRSLANGMCAAGSGLGALTYALATGTMLERIGFSWALRVLGICCFCANTFAAVIVKDRNKAIGAKSVGFDWALFKNWKFVLLQAWSFFFILGYVFVLFSLSNYAKTVVGLSANQASILSALLNLGQGIGRPPIGYFSDSFGRINMSMTTTLLSGVFILAIWIPAKSYGVLIFYAILGGTVLGSYWATVAVVFAEVVGLQLLPSALSITWFVLVIPSIFSEPMALGIAQKSSSGYLGAQVFAGVMYIVSGLCLVPVRAWKIRQVEKAIIEKVEANGESAMTQRTAFVPAMFAWRRV